ncbi:hypothetical protein A8709_07130 [Paenibacillus pectinilyticus]|uniref:Uncharacterized protein n=1 Tax=Paenibacillus pectinilyticus TaxID=512399 RepID=A0A1C0ZTM1_9BACL|nr:hypothetical protein A8709_07130 [Paenibacillus pectinilyticus]
MMKYTDYREMRLVWENVIALQDLRVLKDREDPKDQRELQEQQDREDSKEQPEQKDRGDSKEQ